MHWVPSSTRCRPSSVASRPVVGMSLVSPLRLSTAATAPPRPSLAESTPTNLPLALVNICSKIVPAFRVFQSGAAVGRVDAHELAVGLGEHLLEDRPGLRVVPIGDALVGRDRVARVLDRL